jgi:hypothetical protein
VDNLVALGLLVILAGLIGMLVAVTIWVVAIAGAVGLLLLAPFIVYGFGCGWIKERRRGVE